MQTQTIETHQNQDKVLKESFTLFKGGSLAFLDETLTGKVTEILTTEITETTTKKAYGDNAFKLSTNKGVHVEWEADISPADMMRFASYHIDLSRMHNIPFTSIIITTKEPSTTNYTSPSMTFTPKIINLKNRDADKVLSEIEKKLNTGKHSDINELEIIYMPLYSSKSGMTIADLLDTAIKLTPKVAQDDKRKRHKLQDLLILLTCTFVSEEDINKILEANMRILEDNPAIRTLEEIFIRKGIQKGIDQGMQKGIDQGIQKGIEQAALSMLQEGDDYPRISRITGLSLDRIRELANEHSA